MARSKAETERVNLYLTTEAAALLNKLAPSENKRGAYVSSLILRAAQEADLIEAPAQPGKLDLMILQNQLRSLQKRVETALEGQEG